MTEAESLNARRCAEVVRPKSDLRPFVPGHSVPFAPPLAARKKTAKQSQLERRRANVRSIASPAANGPPIQKSCLGRRPDPAATDPPRFLRSSLELVCAVGHS